jgi:hypothetical protein
LERLFRASSSEHLIPNYDLGAERAVGLFFAKRDGVWRGSRPQEMKQRALLAVAASSMQSVGIQQSHGRSLAGFG